MVGDNDNCQPVVIVMKQYFMNCKMGLRMAWLNELFRMMVKVCQ